MRIELASQLLVPEQKYVASRQRLAAFGQHCHPILEAKGANREGTVR